MRPIQKAALLMMAAGLAACDVYDPSEAGNLVPKTVDEDPTIPSIALNGTVFHYETFGDAAKPVIIFGVEVGSQVDLRVHRMSSHIPAYASW